MPSQARRWRQSFRLGGITDRTNFYEHEPFAFRGQDLEVRRQKVYEIIDEASFQKYVVFVAAAGFITDAYDIFAVNTVLPMVSFVYWDSEFMPNGAYTAMLCATLAGSMIGQVIFGILGDLFGRKKMYGLLLVILLWATLGLAASADGSYQSMSIAAWMFAWRFLMGVGIGGDYPLSATIVSEFAPRRYRSSMLATLFFMQPLGQFLATLVALVVTYLFRHQMQNTQGMQNCNTEECYRAVDRTWRIIVGIGGIPALIAMVIRLQIPESPRYTLDVLLEGKKALKDTEGYFFVPVATPRVSQEELEIGSNDNPALFLRPSSEPKACTTGMQQTNGGWESNEISITDADPRDQSVSQIPRRPTEVHYNETIYNPPPARSVRDDSQSGASPFTLEEWWSGFKRYMFKEGNWIHLAGTMSSWFLLDVSFYGLGMSSPKVIQNLWAGIHTSSQSTPTVYQLLYDNSWHLSIVVSLGALLGGIAMIYVVQHSRPVKVQILFFAVLGIILFVAGGTFKPFLVPEPGSAGSGDHWALVIFYFFCNFFFNLGANATTFIIPAEQFPTQYRCTCHGLSAASGKFGAVIVQLAVGLSGATNLGSTQLGYWLLGFGVLMFAGSVVTQVAVPDSRDAKGQSMSLEDLARGVEYTNELSPQRWNRWHTRLGRVEKDGP